MTQVFNTFVHSTEESLKKLSPDKLLASGLRGMLASIQQSEKIIFSKSTIKMLLENLPNFDEICNEVLARIGNDTPPELSDMNKHNRGSIWLEFEEEIHSPMITPVNALFCWIPGQWIETGKDNLTLYLIRNTYDSITVLERVADNYWVFEPVLHQCPSKNCIFAPQGYLPCNICGEVLTYWAQIFTLCGILAGQYLAEQRYEERIIHHLRRVQRQHSKKKKSIATPYRMKVIDASEILIPIPKLDTQTLPEAAPSWIEEAKAQDDLEYVEIRTRPFTRTYRHPRYVNMQGKTTEFPQGVRRKQPIRKSQERRVLVKASKYET